MDGDGGQVARPGDGLGHAGSHQQGAGQAGAGGVSHGVHVVQGQAGVVQGLSGQGQYPPHVIAGGQLRHHAPIGLVHVDLRIQRMGQQAAFGADDGDAGFVAGAFEAEDNH